MPNHCVCVCVCVCVYTHTHTHTHAHTIHTHLPEGLAGRKTGVVQALRKRGDRQRGVWFQV